MELTKTDNSGRWKPGESGNLQGRPVGSRNQAFVEILNGWRSSGRKVFADGLVARKISSIGDSWDCQSGSSIKPTTRMIKDIASPGES